MAEEGGVRPPGGGGEGGAVRKLGRGNLDFEGGGFGFVNRSSKTPTKATRGRLFFSMSLCCTGIVVCAIKDLDRIVEMWCVTTKC